MGRTSLGERKQCNVRLPPDLISQVDQARGMMSRDQWFERAARAALKPIVAITHPELRQEVHRCKPERLLNTKFTAHGKVRIYACSCGSEIERPT